MSPVHVASCAVQLALETLTLVVNHGAVCAPVGGSTVPANVAPVVGAAVTVGVPVLLAPPAWVVSFRGTSWLRMVGLVVHPPSFFHDMRDGFGFAEDLDEGGGFTFADNSVDF